MSNSPSRLSTVFYIILGIAIAAGIFYAGMWLAEPGIDRYTAASQNIVPLYDFYEGNPCQNTTSVYFIGSSIIGYAVYAPDVQAYLQNQGYNLTVYNLYIPLDTPVMRSLQIESIIKTGPALVIYGLTYRDLITDFWNEDDAILVHDRLLLNDSASYLYSRAELDDINHAPDLYYKKKFLKNAVTSHYLNPLVSGPDYTTDPIEKEVRIARSNLTDPEDILSDSNDPDDEWRPVVPDTSTPQKEALIYNVRRLQSAGIPVILINMPLHPLFPDKITSESRQHYFDTFNETGAVWYDMEMALNDDRYFFDSHHATLDGAMEFSPRMAELIIQEVKSGALHYP
jgi:hypothetical protein